MILSLYALPFVRSNLPAGQGAGLAPGAGAAVVIETDTVSGASPYIFNVSLRSVYGMNGMHADGSRADGFRSMVVAQFTAVSLQKDDRAFVKYNESNRQWSSGLNGNKGLLEIDYLLSLQQLTMLMSST